LVLLWEEFKCVATWRKFIWEILRGIPMVKIEEMFIRKIVMENVIFSFIFFNFKKKIKNKKKNIIIIIIIIIIVGTVVFCIAICKLLFYFY
jgi:hypothetical protein